MNIVEEHARQLWFASLAWKGVDVYKGATVGGLLETLGSIRERALTRELWNQAEELANLIVVNKRRRIKQPKAKMFSIVRLNSKTNNSGQSIKGDAIANVGAKQGVA